MDHDFAAVMRRALEQTRAGDPAEATKTIRAALMPRAAAPRGSATPPSSRGSCAANADGIEDAEIIEEHKGAPPPSPAEASDRAETSRQARRPLREVVDLLGRARKGPVPAGMSKAGRTPAAPLPDGARYETRSFSCPSGSRGYRLYVPAALPDGPQGLVLMLHGCTQDADDFARGTGMNGVAERHGLVVAYPEQTRADNAQACWNWFRPGDQVAGRGEPEILASLARDLATAFGIPKDRVFAAGLSAGGGMAAILGMTHPDVFDAVGIHSGLPHGAAHDVVSAFAAMRGEPAADPVRVLRPVRTIVFHGSADQTVHASNADRIIAAATAGSRVVVATERGRSPGGRAWTRKIARTRDDTVLTEDWRIEGGGHAWSGGSASGSFTDPAGPDASLKMARFFLAEAMSET